jgi:3'-phosphoadenosine 5'-phosphosulfate sulfotransferase (PAPS reductase)/FAD synthetase
LRVSHVVLFSGGLGSWAAAKRVAQKIGTQDLKLLFTDTKYEDEDLYRFINEAAANVGGELITLCDGRDIWEVFRDERFLGNSRIDPCSKILKREITQRWFEANHTPDSVIRYVGIDWTESHRYERILKHSGAWKVEAPLCEAPYLTKKQIRTWAESEGLKIPRLYDLGFDHNNCGGRCVKAGQKHYKTLLQVLPERYLELEAKELEFQQYIGKPVTILRKQENGVKRNISLQEFRLSLQKGEACDEEEWGGCSCFAGPEEE